MPSRLVAALGALLVAAALSSCGGTSQPKPKKPLSPLATVCTTRARAAIASTLGTAPSALSARASMSNQGSPQCAYKRSGGPSVTVIADRGPQPFFRFERTAVEAQQVFSAGRNFPAPIQVPHLGLDADWFPDRDQLMTTDGRTLITAEIAWRHATPNQKQKLAGAAARAYLGPLRHNPSQGY